MVKQEIDGQVVLVGDKTPKADHMYRKTLCHALPMQYVSVAKLQNKLGEAIQNTVCKMIDKMAQEDFVEAKSN